MQFKKSLFLALLAVILISFGCSAQVNWYWTKQGDSTSANASQVATDRNNNVYYAGYCSGSSRMAFGNLGFTLSGSQDDFLVKYNTTGTPIWVRNAKALANFARIYGMSVATDRNNSVIEAGYYNDSIAFGPYHVTAKNASDNAYTVKYAGNGTPLWAKSPSFTNNSASCLAYCAAADKHNNVYVTGYFQDTVVFGAFTLPAKGIDMFLVKYDPNGNVLWATSPKLINNNSNSYGLSVAVDDSCNAYVAGNFNSQVTFGLIAANAPQTEVYLAKYDSAGNAKWVVNTGAIPGQLCPTPVAVDLSNNVYVAAQFENVSLNIGPSTVTDGAPPCSNSLLAKYDRNGNALWATCAAYISNPEVCTIVESSITTDKCENVYWSGFCSDTFAVGCVKVTVPGANINLSKPFSYFMRLNSAGIPFCGMAINDQSNVFFSNGMATDSLSRVYFAGDLYSPSTLVLGNDTVHQYQSDPTTFLSKFSVVPIILGKDTICIGDSVTLQVSLCTGSTYNWSTGATTSSIRVKPLTTTTYYLTTSNCATDTSYLTVFVGTPPIITLAPQNDSVCAGSSTTLTAGGGNKYLWSNGATTSSVSVTPLSNTTYTVTVSNNGTCAKDTTISVVVKPIPTATITVKPANDTICQGDSALFKVIAGCPNATYSWTFPASTKDSVYVSPPATNTYFVKVTCNGCTATFNKLVYVIGRSADAIAGKDTVCSGDSAVWTASGGTTYKWLPPLFTNSPLVYVKNNATYSCVITSKCGIDTLKKTLKVLPPLVIGFTGDTAICPGKDANFNATGGGTYTWNPPASGLSCYNCPNPTASPTVSTTYTLTIGNGKCSHDTVIHLSVNALNPSINHPPRSCDSVTLTAGGGGTYQWNTGATTSSIKVKPASDQTFYVFISKNGCKDSLAATVMTDSPGFNTSGNDTIILGDTVHLHVNGSSSYVWSPSTGLSCTACPNPIGSPSVTTTYTITSLDSIGCPTERTLTVYVETPCADFNVPNVFTPNDDGINDDFVVSVLNPSSYSITIYDRWGKQMYTSTDATTYWNGRINATQNLAPDGVYYYIIKATCTTNNYTKKGFVQLIGEKK